MPALKLAPNTPKIVTFVRDDCWQKHNTNAKGSWVSYSYSVEEDGEKHTWYATPKDHIAVNALEGFGKGAVVSVESRMAEGDRFGTLHFTLVQGAVQEGISVKDSETQELLETMSPNGSSSKPAAAPQSNAPQAPQAAHRSPAKPTSDSILVTMQWAHKAAQAVAEGTEYGAEDIRTIGTTLFLACKETGAWLGLPEPVAEEEKGDERDKKVEMVKEALDGEEVAQDDLPF